MHCASSIKPIGGSWPIDGKRGHDVGKSWAWKRLRTRSKWVGVCHDPWMNRMVGLVESIFADGGDDEEIIRNNLVDHDVGKLAMNQLISHTESSVNWKYPEMSILKVRWK
jgi:hypothetical protein